MDDLAAEFPPFGLRISHEDMVLRLMRDADFPEYLDLLSGPIHEDPTVPWALPWHAAPVPERRRSALQAHWSMRGQMKPDDWTLAFGVYVDGVLIGCQDLLAKDFSRLRVTRSGSWLALKNQGRGWGKRMRQLILHLAFDHLGARIAASEAILGNEASLGVSRAVGYAPNGISFDTWGDRVIELQHVAVTPEKFRRLDDVKIEGVTDELLTMLGATPNANDSENASQPTLKPGTGCDA